VEGSAPAAISADVDTSLEINNSLKQSVMMRRENDIVEKRDVTKVDNLKLKVRTSLIVQIIAALALTVLVANSVSNMPSHG
jgi:adenylate kinase